MSSITRTASDLAFALAGNLMLAGVMWMVITSLLATEDCSPRAALMLDCPVDAR